MNSFKASDLYLASIAFSKEKFNLNINALAEDDLSSVLYYLLDSPLARENLLQAEHTQSAVQDFWHSVENTHRITD